MKFLLAFAAVIAVAVAVPAQRGLVSPIAAGPAPIVAEPGVVGPAPGFPSPIAVGPAPVSPIIVEPISVVDHEAVSVGPALIDFVHEEPVAIVPSPVIIGDIPEGSPAPLVQIIVNVNQPDAAVGPAPAILPEIIPTPVHVVDSGDIIIPAPVQVVDFEPTPIQVVDVAPVAPIQVVEITPVSPIQVVEQAPIAVEPVLVGVPVIPSPAVVLPEELL